MRATPFLSRARAGVAPAALLGVAAVIASLPSSAHAQNYTFTNFDAPPGTNATTVNGLSNTGAAVGFTTPDNVNFTNFVRNANGTFTNLTGINLTGNANGINGSNTVVGAFNGNAFAGSESDLAANVAPATITPTNSDGSVAFGINDGGLIVGQYTVASGAQQGNVLGFLDNGGTFTSFDPNGSATVNAQGINNNGLVVGFYATGNPTLDTQLGFLYNSLTSSTTLLAPPPNTAHVTADGGRVLTQYLGINDAGMAVGYYQTATGSQYGFLYNTNTNGYTFLDDPNAALFSGVQVTQITGISNTGVIDGFYTDATGTQHGFIASPAPEPGSLALAGALALPLVIGVLARRRRATR